MLRNNKSCEMGTNDSCKILGRPPLHQQAARNNDNLQRAGYPSAQVEIPHNKFVVFLLRFCGYLLFLLFFVIPAIVKFYPPILHIVLFCNYVKWPFTSIDHYNASSFGFKHAYNFYLQVDEKVSLGAWHILPEDIKLPSNVELKASSARDLFYNDNPVVLYLHGNAGDRSSSFRVGLYKTLSSRGFHVVAFDYRGYGDSSSWPTKAGMVEDSAVMFDWLKKTTKKGTKIFIWGHSLGSALASELAKKLNEEGVTFAGLVLETPFTNITEVAQTHFLTACFRWLPYYSWVFIEAIKQADIIFPNNQNILKVKEKILVLHAEDDRIVPYWHGRKLYEIASTRTKDPSMTKLITYEYNLGYGHKKITTDPKLMDEFISFMGVF